MMAGNPNWWSMNGMHPQPHSQFIYGGSNSPLSSSNPNPTELHHPSQDCPVRSWSQLLLGGVGEEERLSLFQQQKKLDNWEDQVLNLIPSFSRNDVKQESSNQINYSHVGEDEFQSNSWTRHHQPAMPASSPTSCTTTLSNSILSFAERKNQHRNHDHSSEKCNSMVGVAKKARVQQSAQPALKVRKEKLGDRITALHQLVSPFGKTDTASVLSEAIGYIRFLQGQIEALSSPYMRNAAGNNTVQHSVQERNCSFLDEAPQFLNDAALDGRGGSKQDSQDRSDLRSRGLCLVPISYTQNVGSENGADYWAPAAFGSGF